MADTDLIERATKAIDLFDAICNIHDPSVSAHDRRVRAMAKVLEAVPSPSPAPGVVEALRQAKKRFIAIENCIARNLFHQQEKIKDAQSIATDGWSALDAALASLSQPAKGDNPGLVGAAKLASENVASTVKVSIPANPAQVTDARVEAAVVAYNTTSPGGLANREQMHAALTAAIGAGGQAVAWTWIENDGLRRFADGEHTVAEAKSRGRNITPLYAHPAPSGQAVVVAVKKDSHNDSNGVE